MTFILALSHHPGGLWRERIPLRLARAPVIEHAGRVHQVFDHALADHLAIENGFVALASDDRNPFTGQIALIDDLLAVDAEPLHLTARGWSRDLLALVVECWP